MKYFNSKLTLYFIAVSAIFFLAFKVVYGLDFGSLSLEKIQTYEDEQYIIDLYEDQSLNQYGKYSYLAPYDCNGNTCEVHEYLAPPYTENDTGYVLIMKTDTEIIKSATGKLKPFIDEIITLDILNATTTEIK